MSQQPNKSKRNNSKKELIELVSVQLKEAIADTQATRKHLSRVLSKLHVK